MSSKNKKNKARIKSRASRSRGSLANVSIQRNRRDLGKSSQYNDKALNQLTL